MNELHGYNHFHFFQADPPFYASTFFELLEMIREKKKKEERAYKEANKSSESKRRF